MSDLVADFRGLTEGIGHRKFVFPEDDKLSEHIRQISEKITANDVNLPYYFLRFFDSYTSRHSLHISHLAMVYTKLNEDYVQKKADYDPEDLLMDSLPGEMAVAALLHDIGKIKVDPDILYKDGDLNDREWDEMKKHSAHGVEMVKDWELDTSDYIHGCILDHHERYDGSGYPEGKEGDEISLFAQVLTICDVFGALTENRPYRDAHRADTAIATMKELMKDSTPFNPVLFRRFTLTIDSLLKEVSLEPYEPKQVPGEPNPTLHRGRLV